MKKRLGRLSKSVWQSTILRDVMAEMGRVYLALLAVVVVVGVGMLVGPARQAFLLVEPGVGQRMLEQKVDELYVVPEVGQWWWELEAHDMNRHRVIYNWTTKPGLKWLAFYGLVGMLGVGMILHWTRLLVVVEIKRKPAKGKAYEKPMVYPQAGTVQITARRGVIYISGLSDLVAGLQEFGFIFRLAPVRVVG